MDVLLLVGFDELDGILQGRLAVHHAVRLLIEDADGNVERALDALLGLLILMVYLRAKQDARGVLGAGDLVHLDDGERAHLHGQVVGVAHLLHVLGEHAGGHAGAAEQVDLLLVCHSPFLSLRPSAA